MKEWFSARDLAGLVGLPGHKKSVIIKARREGWQLRKRSGRGGGFEYHISSLPMETQLAIGGHSVQELPPRQEFVAGQSCELVSQGIGLVRVLAVQFEGECPDSVLDALREFWA